MENCVKRLRKIGNSLGVIFPKELMERLGWQTDDNIRMSVNDQDKTVKLERSSFPSSEKKPSIFSRKRNE